MRARRPDEIAAALGLPLEKVMVRNAGVGGSFAAASRAHPTGIHQHVERTLRGLHAADRFDFGAADRNVSFSQYVLDPKPKPDDPPLQPQRGGSAIAWGASPRTTMPKWRKP